METDSSLIVDISFAILASFENWMFREVAAEQTKRSRRFCSSKNIF